MLRSRILQQNNNSDHFCADDVSGPMTAAPSAGAQLPYPTLYGQESAAKPGNTIHALLVNIARMLGSVAAGYDIGLSNKMPYHPKMDPIEAEADEPLVWYQDQPAPSRGPGSGLYPHNTYHGHTPHHRTPLPVAMRFTDSPQPGHVVSVGGDQGDIVQPPPPVATGPGLDRPLYVPTPDYNDGPAAGYTMARTARYYHDQMESEREYYHHDRHNYKDSPRRVPDNTSLAFSNPNYESQQPRAQGRVTFGHRRTPSGSSATYQYDHDRSGPSSSEYNDRHERAPPQVPRRLSRQGSSPFEVERPQTLELTPRTPLRSSVKKYNYNYPSSGHTSSSGLGRSSSGWTPHSGWGSGGGTPTGDTNSSSDEVNIFHPPSKSDSGFVSTNRLTSVSKFSPRGGDKYTDWSPTGGELGGSNREIGNREFSRESELRRSQRQGSYSADSPGHRRHPYADFITDNDIKKGYDNF